MEIHPVIVATLLICIVGVAQSNYTSIVQTTYGPVRGKVLKTVRRNVEYASFQGIPYAKSPEDELRFQPPVEIDNWFEVYDAYQEGNVCIQFNARISNVIGSENCLFLNVYTPQTNFNQIDENNLKPVMAWLHGGGFSIGSGNTDRQGPDFILEEDVIMVTMNYRLGPFGFLNLNHKNATGNMGLKDQHLALKWVKRNIAKFGGDPKKVTLFGQSTGAASVDFHILSDMSKGLFNQSIAMSGSALALFWGAQPGLEALSQAKSLASKLGYKAETNEEILRVLKTASAKDILKKGSENPAVSFRPTVERVSDINSEKFLSKCAVEKYRTGDFNKGPHLLGFTSSEVKVYEPTGHILNIISQVKGVLKNASITLSDPILDIFSNSHNPTIEPADYIELSKTLTDLIVVTGLDSKQRLLFRTNEYPVYYYRFAYDSNLPAEINNRNETFHINGPQHSDDLLYLFYVSPLQLQNKNPGVKLTIDRYVRLLTNFAKYGNPTPHGKKDPLLKVEWPSSKKLGLHFDINEDLTVRPRPVSSNVLRYQALGIGNSRVINGCY